MEYNGEIMDSTPLFVSAESIADAVETVRELLIPEIEEHPDRLLTPAERANISVQIWKKYAPRRVDPNSQTGSALITKLEQDLIKIELGIRFPHADMASAYFLHEHDLQKSEAFLKALMEATESIDSPEQDFSIRAYGLKKVYRPKRYRPKIKKDTSLQRSLLRSSIRRRGKRVPVSFLSARQRRVMMLKQQGRTYSEIGESMGISASEARRVHSAAKRKLKNK